MKHFWSLLLLGPVGVAASMGLRSLGGKGLLIWSQRRDSAKRRILEQIRTAKALLARDDAAGAAGALERALHMAIEAATGLRARGIVRNQLSQALIEAGLAPDASEVAVDIFDACDAVRFTSESSTRLVDILQRAESLVQQLSSQAKRAGRGARVMRRHLVASRLAVLAILAFGAISAHAQAPLDA